MRAPLGLFPPGYTGRSAEGHTGINRYSCRLSAASVCARVQERPPTARATDRSPSATRAIVPRATYLIIHIWSTIILTLHQYTCRAWAFATFVSKSPAKRPRSNVPNTAAIKFPNLGVNDAPELGGTYASDWEQHHNALVEFLQPVAVYIGKYIDRDDEASRWQTTEPLHEEKVLPDAMICLAGAFVWGAILTYSTGRWSEGCRHPLPTGHAEMGLERYQWDSGSMSPTPTNLVNTRKDMWQAVAEPTSAMCTVRPLRGAGISASTVTFAAGASTTAVRPAPNLPPPALPTQEMFIQQLSQKWVAENLEPHRKKSEHGVPVANAESSIATGRGVC
ncbi:hypothetical protein GGX14DRAFT_407929 [Mycena pura]|uniref:Uncharacterized protein n=1 Tax=Mycena pura TaxID=153505 RepID=A0AAD6XY96_9AGAR|nr:hypothetical protein GGX14DRAFT_407929 [Mycena pura]